MELFKDRSSYPKSQAQLNLMGRTHYVDPDTLKFHKSRIVETHITDGGLLFALVESVAMDMNNTKRGYRPVVFDVFGTVHNSYKREDCFKTRAAAVKAMWKLVNSLNAERITLDGIANAERYFTQEMESLRETVNALKANNSISKPTETTEEK